MTDRKQICVATITRGRPRMLQALLGSFLQIELPADADVTFLIVENNTTTTLTPIIDAFTEQRGPQIVHYALEETLGIASARNHALTFALANGFDYLAFADDDEVVDTLWLVSLLNESETHNLDIVGAPVRLMPPEAPMAFWASVIFSGNKQANEYAENRSRRLHASGRSHLIKIATGSWLGRLAFFRRTSLTFDATLGLAGGEDWQLWTDARALGARTGWTPHAIAYEQVPASRLTLHYIYRRNRDHARQIAHQRKTGIANWLRTLTSSLSRLYKIALAVVLMPLRRERSIILATANLGSLIGFIQGIAGMPSRHYQNTDGH